MKAMTLLGMIYLTGCGDKEEKVNVESTLETDQVIEDQTETTEESEETKETELSADDESAFLMFPYNGNSNFVKTINQIPSDHVNVNTFETTMSNQ